MKNRGLGRGLDALLSNEGDNVSSKIETTNVMPLSQLTPGKFQPRKNFNQDSLKELAESIKAQGIIQPILVRMTSNNQFEIIAGERRWQAAKIAKLDNNSNSQNIDKDQISKPRIFICWGNKIYKVAIIGIKTSKESTKKLTK